MSEALTDPLIPIVGVLLIDTVKVTADANSETGSDPVELILTVPDTPTVGVLDIETLSWADERTATAKDPVDVTLTPPGKETGREPVEVTMTCW